MLEDTGFVAVYVLGSSKVSVERLQVRQRNFGWPLRWVEGSRLAQMVMRVMTRCDSVNTRGFDVLSSNVAIIEERR